MSNPVSYVWGRARNLFKAVVNDPLMVEIEIGTVCNRSCAYCPTSTHPRAARNMQMSELQAVLDSLKRHGYKRQINVIGYCEPLLDLEHLYSVLLRIHAEMPNNKIVLATNGDYLTHAAMCFLSFTVDLLLVTRHDENPVFCATVVRQVNGMTIEDGPRPSQLKNRAGSVHIDGCRPMRACFSQYNLTVMNDGKVCFCCHDFGALHGTGINAYRGDFLGEWLKPWRRIKRLAVRLGYRPRECRGCGVAG